MKNELKQKGFTLIELLVVIAIIGILSAVVLVSLNSARQKSRDARRLSDVRQIMTALEIYYNDNGGYPTQASAGANPTADDFGPTGSLTTEWQDYLALWPTSPTPPDGTVCEGTTTGITDSVNQYTYYGRSSDDSLPDSSDPAFYQITFCIGAATGGYPVGELKATPQGILAN